MRIDVRRRREMRLQRREMRLRRRETRLLLLRGTGPAGRGSRFAGPRREPSHAHRGRHDPSDGRGDGGKLRGGCRAPSRGPASTRVRPRTDSREKLRRDVRDFPRPGTPTQIRGGDGPPRGGGARGRRHRNRGEGRPARDAMVGDDRSMRAANNGVIDASAEARRRRPRHRPRRIRVRTRRRRRITRHVRVRRSSRRYRPERSRRGEGGDGDVR